MRKVQTLNILGTLAVLATVGTTFAIDMYPQAANAQTQGMTRRAERRDTRQEARATKHACNASGASSRSGCRQEKRDVKQTGRQNGTPSTNGTMTTPPHRVLANAQNFARSQCAMPVSSLQPLHRI